MAHASEWGRTGRNRKEAGALAWLLTSTSGKPNISLAIARAVAPMTMQASAALSRRMGRAFTVGVSVIIDGLRNLPEHDALARNRDRETYLRAMLVLLPLPQQSPSKEIASVASDLADEPLLRRHDDDQGSTLELKAVALALQARIKLLELDSKIKCEDVWNLLLEMGDCVSGRIGESDRCMLLKCILELSELARRDLRRRALLGDALKVDQRILEILVQCIEKRPLIGDSSIRLALRGIRVLSTVAYGERLFDAISATNDLSTTPSLISKELSALFDCRFHTFCAIAPLLNLVTELNKQASYQGARAQLVESVLRLIKSLPSDRLRDTGCAMILDALDALWPHPRKNALEINKDCLQTARTKLIDYLALCTSENEIFRPLYWIFSLAPFAPAGDPFSYVIDRVAQLCLRQIQDANSLELALPLVQSIVDLTSTSALIPNLVDAGYVRALIKFVNVAADRPTLQCAVRSLISLVQWNQECESLGAQHFVDIVDDDVLSTNLLNLDGIDGTEPLRAALLALCDGVSKAHEDSQRSLSHVLSREDQRFCALLNAVPNIGVTHIQVSWQKVARKLSSLVDDSGAFIKVSSQFRQALDRILEVEEVTS